MIRHVSDDVRVLLVDDDEVVRTSLAKALARQSGVSVVAVAEDGARALVAMGRHSVDVAVVDVEMPGIGGIETAKTIRSEFPDTVVLMLTAFEHKDSLAQCLQLGIAGFLTKDVPPDQLGELIRQAYSGTPVLGAEPARILMDSFAATRPDDPQSVAFRQCIESLPPYLRAVFDRIIQAKSNRVISRELGVTESTVRSYVAELYTITGINNRGELAITAVKCGF